VWGLLERIIWNLPVSAGWWLAAPIHMVPTLVMFIFRKQVYQFVGRRWLQMRMGNANDDGIDVNHGNIDAVEEAINTGSA
jgi:hypothetical protein